MKIKIIKCTNPKWWYNELIGITVDVKNSSNNHTIYLLSDEYTKLYKHMSLGPLGISKNDFIIPREEKLKRILMIRRINC